MVDDKATEFKDIRVMSFNCRGYNTLKKDYINSLLANSEVSVLLLQEHWLSDAQLPILNGINNNICLLSTAVSGFSGADILSGRQYGGCAIIWRADFGYKVKLINTCSNRICAIRLTSDSFQLLIINVYMPYEGRPECTTDFVDQLSIIENIINNNTDCHVIVGGDFNVDFARTSILTSALKDFCTHIGLSPILLHKSSNIDFTYCSNTGCHNVLDHFLLTSWLFDSAVKGSYVIHNVDNLSDHDPVVLHLSIQTKKVNLSEKIYTPVLHGRGLLRKINKNIEVFYLISCRILCYLLMLYYVETFSATFHRTIRTSINMLMILLMHAHLLLRILFHLRQAVNVVVG